MWTLLALVPLVLPQDPDPEPIPPSPYDRVIELEISADDPPIEGFGPAVAAEYQVEFDGVLYVWTSSELDLALRVENVDDGTALEDDDSGGGDAPYLRFSVSEGQYYAILVASKGEVGPLELRVLARPERPGQEEELQRLSYRALDAERLRESGQFDEAVAAYEEVHSGRLQLLQPGHPDLLVARENLAIVLLEKGELERALQLFEDVERSLRHWLPPQHARLIGTRRRIGATLRMLGDLDAAHEVQEEAHAFLTRHARPEDAGLLSAKSELALTLRDGGDFAGALVLEREIHTTRSRTRPPNHIDLLSAKVNLSGTLVFLGETAEAATLAEEAVTRLDEQGYPSEYPLMLHAKENLAIALHKNGDLARALALFDGVHAVCERSLSEDHPRVLRSKANLAAVRFDLGDFEGALEMYEAVYETLKRLYPADHPMRNSAAENLAVVMSEVGDLTGSSKLLEQVVDMDEQLFPPHHPDRIRTKGNLAATYLELGRLEDAHALYEEVYASRAARLHPDHPEVLVPASNLAYTNKLRGNLERALKLEKRVVAANERVLSPDHPDLIANRVNLMATYALLGDGSRAREQALLLLNGQIGRASKLLAQPPRIVRAGALQELDRLPRVLHYMEVTRPEEDDGIDARLFSVIETLRMASTRSTVVALSCADNDELHALREEISEVSAKLNDLGLAPPEAPTELEEWRRALVGLAEERDSLQRKLRVQLAGRGVFTDSIESANVVSNLAPNAALVAYYRYQRPTSENRELEGAQESFQALLAFVVTSDGTVRRVELGACDELQGLAHRFRNALGTPLHARGIAGGASESSASAELGRELRRRVVDPVLAAAGGSEVQLLHIVLDDFLHLVPLDTLPLDDGRLLGEALTLGFEPSLLRLVAPERDRARDGALLAIGGPDFTEAPREVLIDTGDVTDEVGSKVADKPLTTMAPASPPSLRSGAGSFGEFAPLEHAREEVERVGQLYRELCDDEPLVLTEVEASKRALVENARRVRWLHVATHGWFAPEIFLSMRDSIGLKQTVARAERSLRGFAPEVLCGIAFAGANRGRGRAGRVPGILTAEELATLDLSNCELAVLSACETNVGIRRAGQGIQSLQSALHAAGAKTAITSLWKVDDAATRKLFEHFYTNLWGEKMGKADALWKAKMALRDEGHPVRDWGGWVLTGDPD